jgi:hypothetical protein
MQLCSGFTPGLIPDFLTEESDGHFLLDVNSFKSVFELIKGDEIIAVQVSFNHHTLSDRLNLQLSIGNTFEPA